MTVIELTYHINEHHFPACTDRRTPIGSSLSLKKFSSKDINYGLVNLVTSNPIEIFEIDYFDGFP